MNDHKKMIEENFDDINITLFLDRLNKNIYHNYNFEKTVELNQVIKVDQQESIAGRVLLKRTLGNLIFMNISDMNGNLQISIDRSSFENFDDLSNNIQLGDIIGISGITYLTKSGELTLRANKCVPLRKALIPMPDKHAGLQDINLKQRYRYLDLIYDHSQRKKIQARQLIMQSIREFLSDYIEVETPILQNIASGAAATPFSTHHNALDTELFLRIAPELYLKQLLVAGYNRVYEMNKCFRNEGIDTTHLQEFTMLECYTTYISYEKLQDLTVNLLQFICEKISSIQEVKYNYKNIERISYVDLLARYNINYFEINENNIRDIALSHNIDVNIYKSYQSLLDAIYKKCCINNIVDPILVYDYPRHPLSVPKDNNFSYQFQIILKGQEIIKSYLELNDPCIQYENFRQQLDVLNTGDTDAVRMDTNFIKALLYGMPPAGGFGMGIDRVATILTDSDNIRDTLLFPLMKW